MLIKHIRHLDGGCFVNSIYVGYKTKNHLHSSLVDVYLFENSRGFWRHAIFKYMKAMKKYNDKNN